MRTDFAQGAGAPFLSGLLPSLRIAIPSWRFVGIQRTAEVRRARVSREEIASLFGSDLGATRAGAAPEAGAAGTPPSAADPDAQERAIANRIRRALYS